MVKPVLSHPHRLAQKLPSSDWCRLRLPAQLGQPADLEAGFWRRPKRSLVAQGREACGHSARGEQSRLAPGASFEQEAVMLGAYCRASNSTIEQGGEKGPPWES